MTVNRFCSSGLQTMALAAQRVLAGEADIFVAGGVESISCVQNEMNKHMFQEDWLKGNKPEIYWPMLQTAENVAKRYNISREQQDRYGVDSQLKAAQVARRRQVQGRDRADHDHDEGGGQEHRRRVDPGGYRCGGRGHPCRHDLRGRVARSSRRSKAA